jgi:hypothetical protein
MITLRLSEMTSIVCMLTDHIFSTSKTDNLDQMLFDKCNEKCHETKYTLSRSVKISWYSDKMADVKLCFEVWSDIIRDEMVGQVIIWFGENLLE